MSDDIEVRLVDSLVNEPAAVLAVRGWLEMTERGLGDGRLNMSNDQKAVIGYAKNGLDRLPAGVLTFSIQADRTIWIYQAFVEKEFRGRGLFTAMLARLIEFAASTQSQSINFGTHPKNTAMRAVAAKRDFVEDAIVYRYDVR